jgi:hypothetical protein
MTRQNKILLGILAFFPIGYMLFFVASIAIFMLGMFATITAAATSSSAGPPTAFPFMGPFFALFGLHFLAMLVTLAQLVIFILLLVRNPLLRENERLLWLLAILLAGPIGAPLYWYMHVWKAPDVPLMPSA